MSSRTRGAERTRRETVEAMRAQQRAAERRKTLLFVGIAGGVALALVAVGVFGYLNERADDPARKAFSAFGVSAGAASCDEVIDDPATGSSVHVGPAPTSPTRRGSSTRPCRRRPASTSTRPT